MSGDSVTINSTNGDHSGFIYQNQLPEKLIQQYEERIKELKEQLDYWKNKSEDSK
ncbi:hypothetical protein [Chryseobacterium sp. Hurlbut01]|uniref:hypothetical protein n=1 Tax=Chryseobacterium sp. Hurlbut01 TaxID=1681828 RepID=UPI001364C0FF|nr:hypothetical protein [Chryseobacterium sp. Hurlbut01]